MFLSCRTMSSTSESCLRAKTPTEYNLLINWDDDELCELRGTYFPELGQLKDEAGYAHIRLRQSRGRVPKDASKGRILVLTGQVLSSRKASHGRMFVRRNIIHAVDYIISLCGSCATASEPRYTSS